MQSNGSISRSLDIFYTVVRDFTVHLQRYWSIYADVAFLKYITDTWEGASVSWMASFFGQYTEPGSPTQITRCGYVARSVLTAYLKSKQTSGSFRELSGTSECLWYEMRAPTRMFARGTCREASIA